MSFLSGGGFSASRPADLNDSMTGSLKLMTGIRVGGTLSHRLDDSMGELENLSLSSLDACESEDADSIGGHEELQSIRHSLEFNQSTASGNWTAMAAKNPPIRSVTVSVGQSPFDSVPSFDGQNQHKQRAVATAASLVTSTSQLEGLPAQCDWSMESGTMKSSILPPDHNSSFFPVAQNGLPTARRLFSEEDEEESSTSHYSHHSVTHHIVQSHSVKTKTHTKHNTVQRYAVTSSLDSLTFPEASITSTSPYEKDELFPSHTFQTIHTSHQQTEQHLVFDQLPEQASHTSSSGNAAQLGDQPLHHHLIFQGNDEEDMILEQESLSDGGFDDEDFNPEFAGVANPFLQQLTQVEKDMTLRLSQSPLDLTLHTSLFTSIESDCTQPVRVRLQLPRDLMEQEVLSFSIRCLPSFVFEEDVIGRIERRRQRGIDFFGLSFELLYSPTGAVVASGSAAALNSSRLSQTSVLQTSMAGGATTTPGHPVTARVGLFNGEYCITALSAVKGHLRAGEYTLLIMPEEDLEDPLHRASRSPYQSLQVRANLVSSVSATPISSYRVTRGTVGFNEWQFFRFANTESSLKAMRITLRRVPPPGSEADRIRQLREKTYNSQSVAPPLATSISDWGGESGGSGGEVELYVSNQYDGLVPVSRETAVWSCTQADCCSLWISPSDVHLASELPAPLYMTRGGRILPPIKTASFVIGVVGCQDVNHFELSVQTEAVETPSGEISLCGGETRLGVLSDIPGEENESDVGVHSDLTGTGGAGQSMLSFSFSHPTTSRTSEDPYRQIVPLHLKLHRYSHFTANLDPTDSGLATILLNLHEDLSIKDPSLAPWYKHSSITEFAKDRSVDLSFGHSVYSSLMSPTELLSLQQQENTLAGEYLLAVVYASANNERPNHSDYTWRALGGLETLLVLDTSEWRHIGSHCHLSVIILSVTAQDVAQLLELDTPSVQSTATGSLQTTSLTTSSAISSTTHGEEYIDALDRFVANRLLKTRKTPVSVTQPSNNSNMEATTGDLSVRDLRSHVVIWVESESSVTAHQTTAERIQSDLFDQVFSQVDGARLSYRDREGIRVNRSILLPTPTTASTNSAPPGAPGFTFAPLTSSTGAPISTTSGLPPIFKPTLHFSPEGTVRFADAHDELTDEELSFYEARWLGFQSFLKDAGAMDGTVFVDLGAGVGKTVVAAALSEIRFARVVGIEILPLLAQCAEEVTTELSVSAACDVPFEGTGASPMRSGRGNGMGAANLSFQSASTALIGPSLNAASMDDDLNSVFSQHTFSYRVTAVEGLQEKLRRANVELSEMQIIEGDFCQVDWSFADFVFVCALCFSDATLTRILTQAQRLRSGSRIAISNLPDDWTPDPFFSQIKVLRCPLSVGLTDFYILERL